MGEVKHTPGPWEFVPGNEHHGPYVTSEFGNTICDCYTMTEPGVLSADKTRRPVPFLHEMAEPNARLIAASPDFAAGVEQMLAHEQAGGDGWWKGWDMLKAAYAKAKGEPT